MNKENFKKVLDQIDANRSQYDQKNWHRKRFLGLCGTAHCIGGWAQILSGRKADSNFAYHDGKEFLGLTIKEANYVFHMDRTVDQIYQFYETGVIPGQKPEVVEKKEDESLEQLERLVWSEE